MNVAYELEFDIESFLDWVERLHAPTRAGDEAAMTGAPSGSAPGRHDPSNVQPGA